MDGHNAKEEGSTVGADDSVVDVPINTAPEENLSFNDGVSLYEDEPEQVGPLPWLERACLFLVRHLNIGPKET